MNCVACADTNSKIRVTDKGFPSKAVSYLMYKNDLAFNKNIRAIDLFCGIGGNSWGAREAGVQIVAGFDMWKLAGSVYKDNFPEATFYPGKLQDANLRKIKEELGKIDLILASPECTSHSVARGNREPSLESLSLAYQVLRFAKELTPRWIVIENVTRMKKWDGYQKFLDELGENYHFQEHSLVASEYGVPQSRRRLYILCDREQEINPLTVFIETPQRFASHILDLNGRYAFSPLLTEKRAKATLERAQRAISVLGDATPFLLVYYGSDAAGGWQRLDAPLRTITTLDRFALVKPGENGHLLRMLQPPELQAAMGFPENFKLERGTRRDKVHMIGNAVCPPIIKMIVESLLS